MDSTDIQKSSKDVPLIDRESKAHKKITNDLAAGIKKQFETLLKTLADNVVNKVAKLGATGADPLSGIVWKGWEEAPTYAERFKKSYYSVRDAWEALEAADGIFK